MMYNEQRFEEFSKAYHAGLDEAVQMFPQEYAYPREKVPAVAEKMLTAIKTGGIRSVNVTNSIGFKKACGKLGIKYTVKSIEAYLKGAD